MKRIQRKLTCIILSLTALLSSCEYDNSDSYYNVEIEEPGEINVGINLTDVSVNDTIYIYTKTKLYYSINTYGKELFNQDFRLDNAVVLKQGDYIYITPDNIDDKNHELNLDISLKTHSGSLSDLVNLESYEGKYKYNLKFVNADLKLNIKQQKSSDNYLIITWNDPNLKQTAVDHYEVTYSDIKGNQYSKTVSATDRSLLDETYVYGYKVYTIKTYFKDDRIEPWTDYYTPTYRPLTDSDFSINEGNTDKIWVNWTANDFKCKYVVEYPDNEQSIFYTASSSTYIDRLPFPITNMPAKVYILPEATNYSDYKNVSPVSVNVHSHYFGQTIYCAAADTTHKYIYTLSENYISAYNADALWNRYNYKWISNLDSSSKLSVSQATSRIAVQSGNKAIIYADYLWNDKDSIQIEMPANNFGYSLFKITDDDRLIVADTRSANKYLNTYDLKSKELSGQIEITDANATVDASCNGVFRVVISPSFVTLYNEDKLTYRLSNSVHYTKGYFTLDSKYMILSSNEYFRALNLSSFAYSDFVNGRFINIDPFSGYILYADTNFETNHLIYVWNPSTKSDIWRMKVNPQYKGENTYLLNGNIIIGSYFTKISSLYQQ